MNRGPLFDVSNNMRALGAIWFLGLLFVRPAVAEERVDSFIIPGVDISRVTFKEGAWCRYLVVDEALGQIDSTEVYIGVPGQETGEEGVAFWVEVESRPIGAADAEAELMRLLVLESVVRIAQGDSLGKYVLKLYVRSGTRPVREEDPLQYKDFSLVIPTTDTSWDSVAAVPTGTMAGHFSCTKKTRTFRSDKEIPTGNVKLIKKARDDYAVWFCDEVPVFHMAKCEIDRVRETQTQPPIAGIPASGRQNSRTTAEITSFGFDAKPILTIESSER